MEIKNSIAAICLQKGCHKQHLGRQCHRLKTYEVGEFVYWDKGPGIAVFYRQGNNEISAGIIRMGYIESGIELFETPNDIEVKFELIVE